MSTTLITDLFKSLTTEARNTLDTVLDTAGEFEKDARTFIADSREGMRDSALKGKDDAMKLATTTRNKAKSFGDDSREELASYTAEVRDDAESLATDARTTSIDAVGAVRERGVEAAKDGLETIRKGADKVRTVNKQTSKTAKA